MFPLYPIKVNIEIIAILYDGWKIELCPITQDIVTRFPLFGSTIVRHPLRHPFLAIGKYMDSHNKSIQLVCLG